MHFDTKLSELTQFSLAVDNFKCFEIYDVVNSHYIVVYKLFIYFNLNKINFEIVKTLNSG